MFTALSGLPINSNVAYNNSWQSLVDENGRPFFAQLVIPIADTTTSQGGFTLPAFDTITLDPPAKPTTITYSKDSTDVAVITMTYSGDDVATVSLTVL